MSGIKKYFFVLFLYATSFVHAQDPQFSQFYANPVYLNPAFTGKTFEHRLITNYRNQWLGVSNAYASYAVGYDYNAINKNVGLGLQITRDVAGTTGLNNSSAGMSIAWRGDVMRDLELRGGAMISYNFLRLKNDRLVFNDQLYYGSAVSAEYENYSYRNYADFNAGFLFLSEKWWAGLSALHIARPDVDLSGSGGARLPVKWSAHGGYRFMQEKSGSAIKKYISPVLHYRHQKKFDQLDVGVYYYRFPMQLGLWYRGLPVKRYNATIKNHDALVVLAGFEIEKYNLKIGYSYDLPLTKLISNTSGSHELSIIWEIAKKSRRARRTVISVPVF